MVFLTRLEREIEEQWETIELIQLETSEFETMEVNQMFFNSGYILGWIFRPGFL